ncbi:2-oxoglutarate-dependent dioxygenase tropC [Pseudocercospora fuligena]|uniref:2-oxoglutarate-dependent dioxygenase tropC n=1 Tax=Pseudocercospora fuligena TaxID=685502 RepID=A0A8H6VCP6_9PEZI|nr:2-oxoglutarate-dependent dioxygenase tropC [Pseudocercospora fuligena]
MAIGKEIPTIDIAVYLDQASSNEAKAAVVDQVKDACSHYGFLQIKGHGVPLEAQRQMLQCCKTFFDLPLEQKEALSLKNSPSRHGYERLREQVLDKSALPDDKEGFYLGKEEEYEKGFRQGPNQWPDLPLEAFRAPVTSYYNHMLNLARSLLEMLVLGLGHEISVLDTFTQDPVQNLKLLHYPPHTSTNHRQFGAGEHTDFGAITILLQQPGKEGLQVYYSPNDEWLDVPAREDFFIVKMGDLVQKWTHGKYRSTVHRVVNRSGDERYSVPCFYEGNFKATNPFDTADCSTETVEDHVRRKFDSSYGLKS